MAIDVHLVSESGETLDYGSYPTGAGISPNGIFPEWRATAFPMLGNLDEHGDTTFNSNQMESVMSELDLLYERARLTDERLFLDKVVELAQRCRNGTHLYLKFFGD